MKYAVIAAMMLAAPVAAETPCKIADAYQGEMLSGQSERRKTRLELSSAIADAATKGTADQIAGLSSLVIKMAREDAKAYARAAPLRDALRKACR
ncbi:hypothetical protein [Sulfitobacter sp. PS-8MA]|uniref:hypothetical protein n=1 Tax=Sulfitobacter sp. PS-8MA TaxID=3237707 RepID=UPI0034C6D2B3